MPPLESSSRAERAGFAEPRCAEDNEGASKDKKEQMNFEARTIPTIHAALRDGSITATTLATEQLARIRTHDQIAGEEINSFLSLADERALQQAAVVDELVRKGDPLPPLAGVPVGIKDVLTMRGAPATAGSAILKGYHPPYDATAVSRLDAAGAILLGKLELR